MSRSNKDDIQLHVTDEPYTEAEEKFWVGYNTKPVTLQRQSKYDTDWMSVYSTDYVNDQGDNHYSNWDLDEPETH